MRRLPALLFLALTSALLAQDAKPRYEQPALGFHLSNLDGDLAMGLEATSPYFLNGGMAFRASADIAYREGVPVNGDGTMTASSYAVGKLGAVGTGGLIAGCIRLYGEGGFLYISPRPGFSSEASRIGGYGHFGFEFLMGSRNRQGSSYFIELGTVGSDARADKLSGHPYYMNGFAISTGFRAYF